MTENAVEIGGSPVDGGVEHALDELGFGGRELDEHLLDPGDAEAVVDGEPVVARAVHDVAGAAVVGVEWHGRVDRG